MTGSPIETNNVVERAKSLALAGDFSPDDLGGDIGTMSLRNPDGPELLSIVQSLSDRIDVLEGAVAQARVDILVTLGAVRDSMSSEGVACFQSITDRLAASLVVIDR